MPKINRPNTTLPRSHSSLIDPSWDDEWWLIGECPEGTEEPVRFIGPFKHKDHAREDKESNNLARADNGFVYALAQVGIWRETMNELPDSILSRIVNMPQEHTNTNPLWQGPGGDGPNGGVTQSMIIRFLSCRERFRLKYVLGLEPYSKWHHTFGYGNMWHVCEQTLATGNDNWQKMLRGHTHDRVEQYPTQCDEIVKWYNVCLVQFPEYVKYWSEHPDVKNRTPLLQEQVFDVPYQLPSGRTVRLRGKWDSVDLIREETEGKLGRHREVTEGIWLQENKTKGDIDKLQVERQLKYDLQTMMYIIALYEDPPVVHSGSGRYFPRIAGVRYNVVRRPLSGGKGNISPHKAKYTKTKVTPAETMEHFYERLRSDYIAKEPDYWFFRVRAEITEKDLDTFRNETLDPILECMCDWFDWTVDNDAFDWQEHPNKRVNATGLHYRTPFGVYSSLEEGGATEYDAYLDNGSTAGLTRVSELFTELKE